MAKDKADAQATTATQAAATPANPAPRVAELYLLKPWTTGNGTTYPVTGEKDAPLRLDFDDLPAGVDAAAVDFLIASGCAESKAMREARLKAQRA